MVLIGEDAVNIASQLGSYAETQMTGSMDEAIAAAFESAKSGDVVLLAPACASFDMFKSFEERGTVFKQGVRDLKAKVERSLGHNG
jgi:UDP-N-acetylmuramoylalanine--D-glutamate ligase